jgi:hypothetical protein
MSSASAALPDDVEELKRLLLGRDETIAKLLATSSLTSWTQSATSSMIRVYRYRRMHAAASSSTMLNSAWVLTMFWP